MTSSYRILDYAKMVSCAPRFKAYADAISTVVRPGSRVIDLGAGFGIMSLLACNAGAAEVIAIEPNASIELLSELAAANGLSERVSGVRAFSRDFDRPQWADVIISDLRGALPLFEGSIDAIVDARDRLLAPGGTLLPKRDVLRIAIAENPEGYRQSNDPWNNAPNGIDLSPGRRFAVNQPLYRQHLSRRHLLSDPDDLFQIDYRTVTSPDMTASAQLEINRAGTAHGLLVWFDAEIFDGIFFSNAPDEQELVYGQTFFPFENIIDVVPGDRVEAEIRATSSAGHYVWTWTTQAFGETHDTSENSMRQSTFFTEIFAREALGRHKPDYMPTPSAIAQADLFCLSQFDGSTTLERIAHLLLERFPDQFQTLNKALDHTANLAQRYNTASK